MGIKTSKQSISGEQPSYKWEQKLMTKTITKDGRVSHALIVSQNGGAIRAKFPPDWQPNQDTIKMILEQGLHEAQVNLGTGVEYTVGKMEGNMYYASAPDAGGFVAAKTKECILILVYSASQSPGTVNTLATGVKQCMEKRGR